MTPREALLQHNLECLAARRRGEDPPKYSGPPLAGEMLTHMSIPWVNLQWLDLTKTVFCWCDLQFADLSHAHVTQADFGWCNLRNADCSYMDYHKTNFFCADLSKAVIQSPDDIEGFYFYGAKMPVKES